MNPTVTTLFPNIAQGVGEAPHWDTGNATFYMVDIRPWGDQHTGTIFSFDSTTRELKSKEITTGCPTAIIPATDGSFVFTNSQMICQFSSWLSDTTETVLHKVEQGQKTRFNDAKCDPYGRLLAGTMGLVKENPMVLWEENTSALYGLDGKSGQLKTMLSEISLSNGLAWTRDSLKFFHTDSKTSKISAYDYNIDDFTISNPATIFDWSDKPGFPDGCTIDTRDRLWIALFGENKVVCYDITSATVVQEILFPAKDITSCCFGGPHLDQLYVTSKKACNVESDPAGGSLFIVDNLDCCGVPMASFSC